MKKNTLIKATILVAGVASTVALYKNKKAKQSVVDFYNSKCKKETKSEKMKNMAMNAISDLEKAISSIDRTKIDKIINILKDKSKS